ncbi:MAG: pallilysin-related adhesin [Treponema sp.]|nr:pallilysin-related adhesin [Treponema sp.]
MKRKKELFISIAVFAIIAIGIAVYYFRPFDYLWSFDYFWPFNKENNEKQYGGFQSRLIVPSLPDEAGLDSQAQEEYEAENNFNLKASLSEGDSVLSILNFDRGSYAYSEQFVAYRNLNDAENIIYVTFIAYDVQAGSYQRMWNAPTTVSIPGTVNISSNDLLGDHGICVMVTGMNAQREQAMTVFRKNLQQPGSEPFTAIAEILSDGSISIIETERPLSYRQNITNAPPYSITASRQDTESDNLLDRIEINYAYDQLSGKYRQEKINRIPGTQIEQRRLREILSGDQKVFEEFINDLWYHVSPDGTIDKNQYIYFDPGKKEIIFFGDETMQVFSWLYSNQKRLGMYITTGNTAVKTMRRFLDIELRTPDSLLIRVTEDIRLKINVSTSWDGTYRRAGNVFINEENEKSVYAYIDAVYDSSMGRLQFYLNGAYELSFLGNATKGKYVFFKVDGQDLLELRPEQSGIAAGRPEQNVENRESRFIYKLTAAGKTEKKDLFEMENISITRVTIGTKGIQELQEGIIILTKNL